MVFNGVEFVLAFSKGLWLFSGPRLPRLSAPVTLRYDCDRVLSTGPGLEYRGLGKGARPPREQQTTLAPRAVPRPLGTGASQSPVSFLLFLALHCPVQPGPTPPITERRAGSLEGHADSSRPRAAPQVDFAAAAAQLRPSSPGRSRSQLSAAPSSAHPAQTLGLAHLAVRHGAGLRTTPEAG